MFGTAARGHPDFGGSSGVLALDRGEVRWKFATADPVTTSLIVDGGSLPGSCCDQVYFVSGDGASSTATLHAVDVHSGVQQWSATLEASENLDDPPTAPPSFGGHDDILVGFGDKMYSFNKADGAPNWVESISEGGAFVAAPACFEDDIYIGNNGGQLFHLKVEEDNSGLSLSPSKPGKHVGSEMTRTMSQLLSSPVIFGGGEGVLQVDYNGLMVAFSMSGKKELWRYNFGTTMADRRQPAMTRNGEILIGAQNTILAIGGQGGCMMGYKTHDVYDMNEAQPDYFCEICGSGNMSERVGSSECERCLLPCVSTPVRD
jgi:outer membrane protein assembly factor BamB